MAVFETVLQMMALVALGAFWRWRQPGRIPVGPLRSAITELVYHLLLPALVLRVLWQADLGLESLRISAVAAGGILVAMGAALAICRRCGIGGPLAGAAILAAAFGNFTYMGLPVLIAVFGDWAAGVAIQYDLFASTPLLFTLGILLAARFGEVDEPIHPLRRLAAIPPLWAALLAVALNLAGVPLPDGLAQVLTYLGSGVVPLMLLAVGMNLEWRGLGTGSRGPLLMVLAVKLALMPVAVWWLSGALGFAGDMRLALVLEAAMPSMVLGVVICEHFRLDTAFYAAAVTVSTVLALVTLPLWYLLLGGA